MVMKHEYLHNSDEHEELLKKELNYTTFKFDKSFKGLSSEKNSKGNHTFGSDSSKIPSLTSMGESSHKVNPGSPEMKKKQENPFQLITVLENHVCECKAKKFKKRTIQQF